MTTCRHCQRTIVQQEDGAWIDPEATGDDSVWRETCDAHDTFEADHEPGLDTQSSASRQHWIDTGRYLTHEETEEASA
jgi:hypothetical protein